MEIAVPEYNRFLRVRERLTAHLISVGSRTAISQKVIMPLIGVDEDLVKFERMRADWHACREQKFNIGENYFDQLSMVIEEVVVPFARGYFNKYNRPSGIHRMYVAVQADNDPGLLMASYAVRENNAAHSWEFGPCYHINTFGEWFK